MPQKLFQFQPNMPVPKRGGDPMYHQMLEWHDRDIIRIKNATKNSIKYTWDSITRRLNPEDVRDVERFLATKFLDDLTEQEVNNDYMEYGSKLVADMQKDQPYQALDKKKENEEIWLRLRNTYFTKAYREKKKAELAETCILGVVRFYNQTDVIDETIVDESGVPASEIISNRMNTPLSGADAATLSPIIQPNMPILQSNRTPAKHKLAQEATA